MSDDAEMVRLLAEAGQHCEGLARMITTIDALVADVDRSAGEIDTSTEERVDSLCATLERLTQAANEAAQEVGTESDAAAEALSRVTKQADVARDGLDALVTRTEKSAEELDRLLRDLQESVTARVTALDEELGALSTQMTAYGEALAAPVPILREAIAEAGRQLEEACTAHDAAQREWGAATHELIQQVSAQGSAFSSALARLADRHAGLMIVTFNEAADRHNVLMGTLYEAVTDRLRSAIAPCETASAQAHAELSQRAVARTEQLDEADQATAHAPTLVADIAAAVEQLQATRELQP